MSARTDLVERALAEAGEPPDMATQMRANKVSWDLIAFRILSKTGIVVSRETVRGWYGETEVAA